MPTPGAFLDLPPEFCDAQRSRFSVVPVPYDATSTWRKGADRGPRAILDASAQVEWFDIETQRETCREGIVTLDEVLCDGGPEELAAAVERRVGAEFEAGRTPALLGGEHSVSIGAIRAASTRFGDLTTVQIDAHADTRESYHGSKCNHACVMSRAREVGEIVQVGIRSLEADEYERIERERVVFAQEIAAGGADAWLDRIAGRLTGHCYLTIDLDAFDPSVLPATGTPEPGGLDWWQVNAIVGLLARRTRIVAFDVVELCPSEAHHASDFIAAKLAYRVMSEIAAAAPR